MPAAARRMRVRGVVQGVGFRPFVLRLARELGLRGWVLNDGDGVRIHAEGEAAALAALERRLVTDAPPAAVVDAVEAGDADVDPGLAPDFVIRASEDGGSPTARISPDLAVCEDCLGELQDPADPRGGYPYITCTNCGPRYSIILGLPYDRPRTTMADWPLCEACRGQYEDPADRRFHAQPVACPRCGPTYRLEDAGGTVTDVGPAAIAAAAERLRGGAVLALKGIGGYHLACDGGNAAAVQTLRERKFRKEKPFALMAESLGQAETLVVLSEGLRRQLTSMARPIVLAPARTPGAWPGIAPGTDELGVMLPYTPLHHLLVAAGAPTPLVLTSANRSSEPIAYEDSGARTRLAGLADAFLVGERPIARRVDDSVVTERRGRPFMVRRSRGFAPASVARLGTPRPILAVGADLKNAVALAAHGEVFLSQHIGDLGDLAADRAFSETIDDLLSMYAIDRRELIVAHDLHPEYVSTRHALGLEAARHVAIQHHEAHIAAVQLEHGRTAEPVVGLALDGTGYGRDGSIQGGEVLVGSVRDGFRRVDSLAPVMMPGGDAAARHPVQAAAAHLSEIDPARLEAEPFAFPPRFRQARAMIAAGLRCTPTTSAGRLFDAAAAICGFTRETTYEGQAAIWLEQLAATASGAARPVADGRDGAATMRELMRRREAGESPADLADAFHRGLAAALATLARRAAAAAGPDAGIRTVVLAGGVWQNRRLLEAFDAALGPDLEVLVPERVPVNDGGISLGQVALAASAAGESGGG
jgi:hydrogenase maturation protein HypF